MVAVEADLELLLNPTTLSLLTQVEKFLARHNTQAYIVGGFLRDLILTRDTADIDIALEADALEVAPEVATYLGAKFAPLDKVNRVGRVILPKPEVHPGAGQWQIDFSTIEDDIEHDLKRRDFTIDAMAINLDRIIKGTAADEIIDPFNGLKDIQQRVVRAISDPVF